MTLTVVMYISDIYDKNRKPVSALTFQSLKVLIHCLGDLF